MMNGYPPIIQKKRSAISSIAWGISAVLITGIICSTGLAVYAMVILDNKTDGVMHLVRDGLRGLPELKEALPPVLADAIDDRRAPDYVSQLDVSARLADSNERPGWLRPIVEVRNKGNQVVSLLSMRVVLVDDDGDPVAESTDWGATPIAGEGCWRGPLMPGSVRRFLCNGFRFHNYDKHELDRLRPEIEITDIRLWTGSQTNSAAPKDAGGKT